MAASKSEAAKIREAAEKRLSEVRAALTPLHAEEQELVAMVGDGQPAPEPEAEPQKPRSASPAKPQRQRRSRRGGTREEQALKLIAEKPGINASSVAEALKIKPNYLYRVLGDAEKAGRVRKDGRQYFPVEA